jgi:2-oxo-4-hydroxy-4-carboxy-5-ureidoimidazoline decarboxylase
MTLAELNAADRDEFTRAIGWVFEHSPWVAERAWDRRPFGSVGILHEAMTRVVAEASPDEQIALIRAHPDLGTRFRTAEPMTGASAREQRGAGLDRLSVSELERLTTLNAAYREKFGFPFLFAVRGSTTQQVIDALEARLPRTHEEELLEALRQVSRIAGFRLRDALF